VTVKKLSPSLSTTPSANTVVVGNTVSDSAILTTATPTAGGTVKYSLFSNGVCNGAPVASSTVTVTGGVVPSSPNFLISNVGSGEVSFTAVYSGDANNDGAPSACEGPITVSQATPSLSTNPSSFNIKAGTSVTDTATLTSATTNAGGTVTYNLWNDNACGGSGGSIVQSFTVTVTDGSVPSVSFTIPISGSYSISAVYSGDANNAGPVASGCEATITVT